MINNGFASTANSGSTSSVSGASIQLQNEYKFGATYSDRIVLRFDKIYQFISVNINIGTLATNPPAYNTQNYMFAPYANISTTKFSITCSNNDMTISMKNDNTGTWRAEFVIRVYG